MKTCECHGDDVVVVYIYSSEKEDLGYDECPLCSQERIVNDLEKQNEKLTSDNKLLYYLLKSTVGQTKEQLKKLYDEMTHIGREPLTKLAGAIYEAIDHKGVTNE